MWIEPQTPLPAVYQITDPYDPDRDSYYVRAVVRDSLTGAVLQAVDLESAGNGRYVEQFYAPADVTGLGRQIDVTITVYTDSGYSIKSDKYQEIIEKWYVKNLARLSGGWGGEEVDYKRIKKMLDALKEGIVKAIEIPDAPNLEPILVGIQEVKNAVEAIEMPEHEETDMQPVIRAVEGAEKRITKAVADIEIPEPEKLDLAPVLEAIDELEDSFEEMVAASAVDQVDEITEGVGARVADMLAGDKERRLNMKQVMKNFIDMSEEGEEAPESVLPKPAPVNPAVTEMLNKLKR